MTCFWDGILQALDTTDFKLVGHNSLNCRQLINILKAKNIEIDDVTWNGKKLTKQEIKEHFDAIKTYDINTIKNGHLCSSCDSFLLLICQLFNVTIKHLYMNVNIEYKNEKIQRKTLNFASNGGHFWKK